MSGLDGLGWPEDLPVKKFTERKGEQDVGGISTIFKNYSVGCEIIITAPDAESLCDALKNLFPTSEFDEEKFRATSTTIHRKKSP